MSGAGRGRGASAKPAEKQAPPKKGGRGAKIDKDIIEDLDDYDEDMNEKELPPASS